MPFKKSRAAKPGLQSNLTCPTMKGKSEPIIAMIWSSVDRQLVTVSLLKCQWLILPVHYSKMTQFQRIMFLNLNIAGRGLTRIERGILSFWACLLIINRNCSYGQLRIYQPKTEQMERLPYFLASVKCSAIGPVIKMTNNDNTLRIKIMVKRKTPNVAESVCKVPEDEGMNFFCFIKPIIINPPAIGAKRPDSIAIAVARFQNKVLLPRPAKLEPLPAVEETNS